MKIKRADIDILLKSREFILITRLRREKAAEEWDNKDVSCELHTIFRCCKQIRQRPFFYYSRMRYAFLRGSNCHQITEHIYLITNIIRPMLWVYTVLRKTYKFLLSENVCNFFVANWVPVSLLTKHLK